MTAAQLALAPRILGQTPTTNPNFVLTERDLVLVAAALEWGCEENKRRGNEAEALEMAALRERWMRVSLLGARRMDCGRELAAPFPRQHHAVVSHHKDSEAMRSVDP